LKNDKLPILKNEDTLIVPLNEQMSDQDLEIFEESLLQSGRRSTKIRKIVLDVSSLESMDLHAARKLCRLVKKLEMMDLRTVVVGMRPEVAITLMDIGIDLPNVKTATSLERGLALLRRSAAE
jgi:rsbT antagonist protein RsbS